MKKNKTKPKKTRASFIKLTTHRVFALAIVSLLLIVIVQSYFIANLFFWTKDTNNRDFKDLIYQAHFGLYELGKEAVYKDVPGGNYQIQKAKLVIPIDNDKFTGVSALYGAAESADSYDELTLTHRSALTQAQSILHNGSVDNDFSSTVRKSSACVKQAKVILGKMSEEQIAQQSSDEYELITTKTLQDGRLASVFASTLCSQDSREFAQFVVNMESY